MSTVYTIDASINGGRTFSSYMSSYTGQLSTSTFNLWLPISGSRSVILRSYISGSVAGNPNSDTNFFNVGGTQLNFTSYYTTYTNQYICVVKASEFNNSWNTSLYDSSGSSILYNSMTDTSGSNIQLDTTNSEFGTYVTSIGLYDDALILVAYAKFARPIKLSKYYDSIFILKFDS